MFQIQWLRRLVRKHTKPIPEAYADVWKQRLSYIYMFLAWNAFGVVAYNVYKGKANWATYHGLSPEEGTAAQQWSKTLGIKEATVYKMSGFSVQDKYQINNEFDNVKQEAVRSVITRPDQPKKVAEELTE